MRLDVDPDSGVPPYEQVREAIRAQVASGALPPGHRLPPVRELASSLRLAANTVARAVARGVHGATALPFLGALPAWSDRFG